MMGKVVGNKSGGITRRQIIKSLENQFKEFRLYLGFILALSYVGSLLSYSFLCLLLRVFKQGSDMLTSVPWEDDHIPSCAERGRKHEV